MASTAVAAQHQQVVLVQSPQDKREYRRLKLDNGLDVLLIHDPEMASALEGQDDDVDEEDGYEEDDDDDGDEDEDEDGDEDMEGDVHKEVGAWRWLSCCCCCFVCVFVLVLKTYRCGAWRQPSCSAPFLLLAYYFSKTTV